MARKSGNQNVLAQDIFEMGRRAGLTQALSVAEGAKSFWDEDSMAHDGAQSVVDKIKQEVAKHQPEALKGIKL